MKVGKGKYLIIAWLNLMTKPLRFSKMVKFAMMEVELTVLDQK
jgi:hypothetical protein